MNEEEIQYKIIIFPFTRSAALEIQNYLIAFTQKAIDIEGVKVEKKP
jgi:hypothetical protein